MRFSPEEIVRFAEVLDESPPEAVLIPPHLGALIESLPDEFRMRAIVAIARDHELFEQAEEIRRKARLPPPKVDRRGKPTAATTAKITRRDEAIIALAALGFSSGQIAKYVAKSPSWRRLELKEFERLARNAYEATGKAVGVRQIQRIIEKNAT